MVLVTCDANKQIKWVMAYREVDMNKGLIGDLIVICSIQFALGDGCLDDDGNYEKYRLTRYARCW